MKYSQLISFNPIEDVIQLVTAGNKDKAREYVKTYVMSDTMADALQAPMIDQLQMDEVVDNKGVLIVGNYGTGKSHLMSVISAIATDADNLQYLQNKKFAQQMEHIAGKFEVLRNNGFETTDVAIAAAKESGADIAIICSTDDTYPELVPVLAKGIKASTPGMKVMVAGAAPAELKDEWAAAGVDEYVNVKANCLAILTAIQKERRIC